MTFRALTCPSCGAPLPKEAVVQVVECAYCKATVAWQRTVVTAEELRAVAARALGKPAEGRPTLSVAGVDYLVEGRIASGTHATVYRGQRASRIGERVALHVAHDAASATACARAFETLARLGNSTATGAAHFTRRLPFAIGAGPARADDRALPHAAVYGLPTGFATDLETLAGRFRDGLPLEHVVWIGRRVLELLDFLHRAGHVHGAVLPRHVLVHARDHGAMLVGYSNATAVHGRAPLHTFEDGDERLLPDEVVEGGALRPGHDVATLAAGLLHVAAGRDERTHPVVAALRAAAESADSTAMAFHARLADTAREAFGPPRFVPLHVPKG